MIELNAGLGLNAAASQNPGPISVTLDSESLDCLRQCMKADRSVLEDDLGWPDWMVDEVCRVLEDFTGEKT
jgi:hypothetical protein